MGLRREPNPRNEGTRARGFEEFLGALGTHEEKHARNLEP